MGQQTSQYSDMIPPLSTNGQVAEFFLNNSSPTPIALKSFKSVPASQPRLRHDHKVDDVIAQSIDKVCQGPLYKEVLYDKINMSGNTSNKDDKIVLSTLPPFKDTPKSSENSIIETSPTPKYRLVRRPAMCLRCKQDKAAKKTSTTSIGISPLNGSANQGYVTPPNQQLVVTLPKTSTPKGQGRPHSCRIQPPKSVHFANSTLEQEPRSPPVYKQPPLPPLPLNLDDTSSPSMMTSEPRPQPLGRESHYDCQEVYVKFQPRHVNTYTPEKVQVKTDINRALGCGTTAKKVLFENPTPESSQSIVATTRNTAVQNLQQDQQQQQQQVVSSGEICVSSQKSDYQNDEDILLDSYLTVNVDSSIKYDGCVQQWLKDIRVLAEAECLNVLQAKTLTKDPGMLMAAAVRNSQDTIAALQRRLEFVLEDFEFVIESLSSKRWSEFCEYAMNLISNIQETLRDCHCSTDIEIVHTSKTEVCLKRACEDLEEFLKRNSDKSQTEERKSTVKRNLHSVLRTLKELIDQFTIEEMTVIVKSIEETSSVYCLQMAMAALAMIGQTGETMCHLITKSGGIKSLLTVCLENKWRPLRAAALRILTIICCAPEAIQQLEKAGGIQVLCDVLCEANLEESLRSEAAGLLAQITAPWMDCESETLKGLVENMNNLIRALTDLARTTQSSEVLLLTAAALANLSFLDAKACSCFQIDGTLQVLIGACTQNALGDSLFIKDQVATVLANMAAIGSCKTSVIEAGSLVLLLSFLQVRPLKSMNDAELAACERVQQKSAIALSRLCGDLKTATSVAQMHGVKRLVKLCKDGYERNNSDSVLVAALATLRKIATVCGNSEFKALNAEELVEPKLWDSFLIYCSKQESYV